MTEYLIRRLLQSILVLFLISILTFTMIHAAPGGPTQMFLGPGLSPEVAKIQAHNLGLRSSHPGAVHHMAGKLIEGGSGLYIQKPYSRWRHLMADRFEYDGVNGSRMASFVVNCDPMGDLQQHS